MSRATGNNLKNFRVIHNSLFNEGLAEFLFEGY